jgi:serine/threonine protein kinase
LAVAPSALTDALRDRYRIERELGRGGMAVVMLARDLKHQRRVAIKVLRPELSQSLGTDRFLREIEVAAQLTHPHILPVFDSGAANGLLYYVMPYVEGGSLRAWLEPIRSGPCISFSRFRTPSVL